MEIDYLGLVINSHANVDLICEIQKLLYVTPEMCFLFYGMGWVSVALHQIFVIILFPAKGGHFDDFSLHLL